MGGAAEQRPPGRAAPAPAPAAAMVSGRGAGAHVCLVLCAVLTVYAAVSRRAQLLPLLPARPAVPFFPPGSPVSDYSSGQLSAALARAAARHVSLLVFYAPWDAACQRARHELLRTATLLAGQVEVLAVNCWHVGGDCRKTIKTIKAFPLVVVSMRHGRGLQYSGPMEAAHLVRFVERVLRPLRRLETAADLARLQAASTTVAVGYTPFSSGRPPPAYFSLLRASLLSLEERPSADLSWAVVTNGRAAERLRMAHLAGGLAVVNWNGTTVLRQPSGGALTAEVMRSYVSVRRSEVAAWLELPADKSDTLQRALSRAAVLLVLDRRRPLAPAADVETLTQVRRVWLDYNNCNRSETVRAMGQRQPTMAADAARSERRRAESCRHWAEDAGPSDTSSAQDTCRSDTGPSDTCRPDTGAAQDTCPVRTLSGGVGQPDRTAGHRPWDMDHPDPGLRAMVRQQRTALCLGLLTDLQQHQQPPGQHQQSQTQDEPLTVNITGLRCATNRTLDIYALDSARHAALARRLGLGGATGAVILDSPAESQYVLEGPVSTASLSRFIADYTAGRLERRLVSRSGAEPAALGTEAGPSDGPPEYQEHGPTAGGWESSGERSESGPACGGPGSVCGGVLSADGESPSGAAHHPAVRHVSGVTEMTSETFAPVALNASEDVLVYFYSAGCGHCSALFHVFLAAWRLLANSGLRFARIDGADNDLRWEFTLESFPTVMYLPAHRKSESRVFPADLPLTLGYLLRFILANAGGAVRTAFFHGQCDAACRATAAYRARRQAALVRRSQVSRVWRTVRRRATALARLRRALRVVVTAGTGYGRS